MRFVSSLLSLFALTSYVAAQTCIITVPQNPLSPAGLASVYTQTGCAQAGGTATFVEAVILNLDTGAISAYSPLIIDAGTTPLVLPTVPQLPVNRVVGLWFGTNGGATQLVTSTPGDSLQQGACINGGGAQYSIFGQFAACNAQAWFDAARALQLAGKLKLPNLGNGFDLNPCPTTHDFGIVDQDQSDNVNTKYLIVTTNGAQTVIQNTPVNLANNPGAVPVGNGSDEVLITLVNAAINCTTWKVPDLTDVTATTLTATIATNELLGSLTVSPVAFVPLNHAMTLNNGVPDIEKTNAYRVNVGQEPITSLAQGALAPYCANLYAVGSLRIANWLPKTLNAPSPDMVAANLGSFLVNRFLASTGPLNFNCSKFFPGLKTPLSNIINAQGAIQFVQLPGQTVAQLIGSNFFTPNAINDKQDPLNVLVNGTSSVFTVGAVNGLNAAPVTTGTTGAGAGTGTNTVVTTTSTTVFNGMWFGIGIGIGAAVILLIDLIFLFYKSSKIRSNSVNNALARV